VGSLINYGADLNAKSRTRTVHGVKVKWTPLHAAIEKEYRDIVLLLLEHGADPEIRSSRDETALWTASRCGCADIVRQLISHGADPNAEWEYERWTALHVASHHGRPEIVRILLEHGANLDALDPYGRTALHIAWEITVIELLLDHGMNVDVRDKEGWTPLHKVAYSLELQVLVVLLDRGADPHARTNKGETPIQLAAGAPHRWESKEVRLQVIQLFSERTGKRI
jgi:ankyrin repeat protein